MLLNWIADTTPATYSVFKTKKVSPSASLLALAALP